MDKLFNIEDGQLFGGVRNNLFKAEDSSFAPENVVSEESSENMQLIKSAFVNAQAGRNFTYLGRVYTVDVEETRSIICEPIAKANVPLVDFVDEASFASALLLIKASIERYPKDTTSDALAKARQESSSMLSGHRLNDLFEDDSLDKAVVEKNNALIEKAKKGTPEYDEWLRKYREKRGKKQDNPEGDKRAKKEDEEGEGRRKKEDAESARRILENGPEGKRTSSKEPEGKETSSREPEGKGSSKETTDTSKFERFTTNQMVDKLNKEAGLTSAINKVASGSGPQTLKVDINGSEVEIKVTGGGDDRVRLSTTYPSGSKAYSDFVYVSSTPEEAVKELASSISRNNSAGRIGGASETRRTASKKQQLETGGPAKSFGDIKYKDSMLPSGSIPVALAEKASSLNEELRASIKSPSYNEINSAKAGDKFTIGGSTFEVSEVPTGYGYTRKELVYLDGDDRIPIRYNSDAYLYSKEATAAVLSDPELRSYVTEERFPAFAAQRKAEATRVFHDEYVAKVQAKVDKEANKSVASYKQAVKERGETGVYPKISPALLDASPELKDRATRQFEAFVKQKFAENPKMKRFKAGSWGAEGYDKFLEENYGDDAVFLSTNAYRKLSQDIATTRGRIDHAYYTNTGSPDISETPKPVFEREKF